MGNPEPGEVAQRMTRARRAHELDEIAGQIKIERGPRQPQHLAGKAELAAIVEMLDQAHASESRGRQHPPARAR